MASNPSRPALSDAVAALVLALAAAGLVEDGLVNGFFGVRLRALPAIPLPKPSVAAPPPAPVAPPPTAAARAAAMPGVFRDCADVCPAMVKIPAGEFDMGSPASEPNRSTDEGPVHRVTIGYAFAVSEYPITVGEFSRFVVDAHYDTGNSCYTFEAGDSEFQSRDGRNWRTVGFAQHDTSPVVCVDWSDASAYAAWLSRKTGQTYRLLSDAEYEYVNRAGSSTAYWWGDDPSTACAHANGADQDLQPQGAASWTYNTCHDGFVFTSPVGSFEPNTFGLYDTTGNVWSWVADCYHDSYAGAPTDGSVNTGGDCGLRVLRGGSWVNDPGNLRSARRVRSQAGFRYDDTGFRVARIF